MPTRGRVRDLVDMVEAGKYVEAIQVFYAEDASMAENNEEPRRGRDALIAGETAMLAAISISTKPGTRFVVEGDRAVINWVFTMTYPDGSGFIFEELAYQLWQDDRVVEERFFYDPGQRKPPQKAAAHG